MPPDDARRARAEFTLAWGGVRLDGGCRRRPIPCRATQGPRADWAILQIGLSESASLPRSRSSPKPSYLDTIAPVFGANLAAERKRAFW